MKVDAWTCAPATARDLESAQRKSTSDRTRRMVNNACAGQSHEKTLVEARSEDHRSLHVGGCVSVCFTVSVCVCPRPIVLVFFFFFF